jgi:hypothetical protein
LKIICHAFFPIIPSQKNQGNKNSFPSDKQKEGAEILPPWADFQLIEDEKEGQIVYFSPFISESFG